MPGRRYTRRRGMAPIITSIKNTQDATDSTGTTLQSALIAKAVTSPSPTVKTDVSHGCLIKAIWLNFDVCGLAATGVLQRHALYLIKNPGDNLTEPGAFSVGSSNEKKFVIRQWQAMTMRNQDGNPPFHFEGWIKIPKRYWRMGTDDVWNLMHEASTSVGHFSLQAIYKWYR